MPAAPAISDAEWEVMNVIWAGEAPMTATDIVHRLAGNRSWSPRTIKTLLNRLIKKGALKFESQGKRYLYRPAVRQDQCVRAASRSFLSRVFAGAAGPMLVHLVNDTELTPAEIQALQQALNRKKSRRSSKGAQHADLK
jgi:BlaI family penicillinase repressor